MQLIDFRKGLVGRKLAGKYVLQRPIGAGGMGSVYRAVQQGTEARVAVKILSRDTPDLRTASRFRQEAEMTARLTHPNTVRVLDFGVDDDLFFLVTEFLAGSDLTRFLRRGGQPDNFLVHVLFQVVSSLAEAHSKGVIHRDIKPNNIMLIHHVGWPSFVKVIDFGIARAVGGPGHGTKGLLGTLGYIAPEQTDSERTPDVRSDLYALGCLAYELATGQLPFDGITHRSAPLDILEAHLSSEPVPVQDIKPSVDDDVAQLIMGLLHKDPSRRPSSAGELVLPLNALKLKFLRRQSDDRLAGIASMNETEMTAVQNESPDTFVFQESSSLFGEKTRTDMDDATDVVPSHDSTQ